MEIKESHKIKINNLPEDYEKYMWITFRTINNEHWYYGAWLPGEHAYDKALEQALIVQAQIAPSCIVARA